MSDSRRWYAVYTHPHKEFRAEANLRRQGLETFLPRYLRTRCHARKTETVARPLFPRYLFVSLDLKTDRWRTVQSTFGVNNLVFGGDEPLAISREIIEQIRAREGADGFVALGLPAGVGLGSRVRLIDGLFENAKGVIDRISDDRRVAILLELFGREVRTFVPSASIGVA